MGKPQHSKKEVSMTKFRHNETEYKGNENWGQELHVVVQSLGSV